MTNPQTSVIRSRRALLDAVERNKSIEYILAELEPYKDRKQEIQKQTETLMKICLVDMGYIPLYLQYIFRRVLLEYKCGDFSGMYFDMKYKDGTLIDVWGGRAGDLQTALLTKTKASIVKGVNHTLAAKGLQSVTIATIGTKFIETAFGEIINIKLMLEGVAASVGVGMSSLYTVVSAGCVGALTSALSCTCTTTADVKFSLATFIEMLEFFDPPELVKELRLDIFLDLLREELRAHSIFDKDYLNYLLRDFQYYDDFVGFSKNVKVPDYQSTVPFCMLLLQDFTAGDVTEYVLGVINGFCEMNDINFTKAVEKFDKLNKSTKSQAINSQRILAERRKNKNKRAVIEVDPYV